MNKKVAFANKWTEYAETVFGEDDDSSGDKEDEEPTKQARLKKKASSSSLTWAVIQQDETEDGEKGYPRLPELPPNTAKHFFKGAKSLVRQFVKAVYSQSFMCLSSWAN
jgi:hypothetical protein